MILSDFLSRQIEDDSNPHEIIRISFNIWEILHDNYHQLTTDTYNVQTRVQVRAQANTPTVPDTQLKKQVTRLPIQSGEEEQGIKTLFSRITQHTPRGIVLPPEFMSIVVTPNDRPLPKPPNIDETNTDLHQGPDLRTDIEENSPHQEGILCGPRSVLSTAATGTDQTGEHLEIHTKTPSATSQHRQNS